jgi:hypothetical protein
LAEPIMPRGLLLVASSDNGKSPTVAHGAAGHGVGGKLKSRSLIVALSDVCKRDRKCCLKRHS